MLRLSSSLPGHFEGTPSKRIRRMTSDKSHNLETIQGLISGNIDGLDMPTCHIKNKIHSDGDVSTDSGNFSDCDINISHIERQLDESDVPLIKSVQQQAEKKQNNTSDHLTRLHSSDNLVLPVVSDSVSLTEQNKSGGNVQITQHSGHEVNATSGEDNDHNNNTYYKGIEQRLAFNEIENDGGQSESVSDDDSVTDDDESNVRSDTDNEMDEQNEETTASVRESSTDSDTSDDEQGKEESEHVEVVDECEEISKRLIWRNATRERKSQAQIVPSEDSDSDDTAAIWQTIFGSDSDEESHKTRNSRKRQKMSNGRRRRSADQWQNLDSYVSNISDVQGYSSVTSVVNCRLLTGVSRYTFPRVSMMDIDDLIEVWENDFQVNKHVIPRMSLWNEKCIIPDKDNDTKNFKKYQLFRFLYKQWENCNKNKEQWYIKYCNLDLWEIAGCSFKDVNGNKT